MFTRTRKSIPRKILGFIPLIACLALMLSNLSVLDTAALLKCIALLVVIGGIGVYKLFGIHMHKIAESIVGIVLFIVGPVITFEIVRVIISAPRYEAYIYETNLLFYIVIQLVIFILTQSPRVSVIATVIISGLVHMINEVVTLIRGTPLVPTDLYALKTAMTVTSPADWHLNAAMVTGVLMAVAVCMLVSCFKLSYPKWFLRLGAAVVALVACVFVCVSIWNIDYTEYSTSTFDQESTNDLNGVALSFYINVRKMSFDEPEGYDEDALMEYLSQYIDEVLPEGKELPNIIVIMNESFSDLSYMGKFKTDVDYMPYYNSLIKNYPHGKLLVSVLGGGTCNTEFEFLTGLSMLNVPSGSYVYMQHITDDVPSMASYLEQYGYQTVAMHPFYEICWKRNSVYRFMGFDDFISGEDMSDDYGLYQSADRWNKGFGDNVEYIRTLISDSYFYKQVINQFENKTSDRIFIFGVTVQNHSTYEYDGDDFETTVHITGSDGAYPRTEQYLSLVKASDEALEELITYFEGVDEDTVIVFFGDHQPNIEMEFLDEIAPNRNEIVNLYLARFQTPFVIWANFDLEYDRKDLGIISANYLGVETLKLAGVPLSAEYQMIDDLRSTAAAMAAWGYYDRFTCWYDRQESYSDEGMNMYNYYTYYILGK